MKDLEKVNGAQLLSFWKNLSIGLLVMMGTLFLSRVLPFYFSPIIGLVSAAVLYTMLYNNKLVVNSTCMVVPYAMFYCMICYSFVAIITNVLDIWSMLHIPKELSFFNDPYVASLLMDPVCFIVLLVFYLRRNRLSICVDCKLSKGLTIERGKLGEILNVESRFQLKNLIWLYGILSVVVWTYYYVFYYKNALINNRDWYIFLWINIIAFVIDELYFASRYYNIYLDLKENGEIITEAELSDMTTKTYIRYYLICGEHVYVNTRIADPHKADRLIMDTPFVTKRNVNGITTAEVHNIIQRLTGVMGGELRFFYGRKSVDISKHRILRYFYFLDGTPEDYPDLKVEGEWVDFNFLKMVYNTQPRDMSVNLLTDISRMTTIILTQKLFDERGYRKIKIKSYNPVYTLKEVREKNYDFQDDKWLRVAMYNSDTRGFHVRRWLDKFTGGTKKSGEWERNH